MTRLEAAEEQERLASVPATTSWLVGWLAKPGEREKGGCEARASVGVGDGDAEGWVTYSEREEEGCELRR